MRPGQSSSQPPGPFPELAGRTILQIIPELNAGGAERTTIDVAAALVASGARALVACEGGRLVSELQARGGLWIPFPAKTKNPLKMALNVGRLAEAAPRRARASRACALARAGLGGAGRGPPHEASVGDDLPRRLCRNERAQGALQFGDGARRRGDRQLVFHARPHRRDASVREGSHRRRPSRRRPARLPARAGRGRPRAEAAPRMGRGAGRAHRSARRAPHAMEGPARP